MQRVGLSATLHREIEFYKLFATRGSPHIPTTFWSGVQDNVFIIVMRMFEMDLDEMF